MKMGIRRGSGRGPIVLLAAIVLGGCAAGDNAVAPRPLIGDVSRGFVSVPPPASWGTKPEVVEPELFEVCKHFVGAQAGTQASFTFSGTSTNANGTVPVGPLNFNLGDGQCREVWASDVGFNDLLSVSETAPTGTGWSTSWVKTVIVRNPDNSFTTTVTNGTGLGPVGGAVAGRAGVLVVFTNTLTPPPPPFLEGRMTGGGAQIDGNGFRISRGFTIHCDIILSNNLELNWKANGVENKWHLDKPITKAICTDDPTIDETPPRAPFNTFYGEGYGKLNGVEGSFVTFTFVDAGEPGKNDKTAIKIWSPGGALVLDVPLAKLTNGNIQAHYDQPHKQKP